MRTVCYKCRKSLISAVKSHKGEHLHLRGILRQEMGSYLCIASNGVPPSVSKRYYNRAKPACRCSLNDKLAMRRSAVKPSIRTKEQVVFARVNGDVTLKCLVEASPKSLTSWYAETGNADRNANAFFSSDWKSKSLKIGLSERHEVTESAINDYTYQVNLTIRRVRPSDWTAYTCFTENSFGTASASVRLREQHKSASGRRVAHRKSKDQFEDAPEHVDGEYLPALPGAHYGSTDFPGSGSPDRDGGARRTPASTGRQIILNQHSQQRYRAYNK
ncbi:hypothetical protein TSAR_012572 [Trichomalopsis sarcophagae]|uniref:Ig-like domain-containing protein n=1 Tax=Trichomalopsis sarcophagae TaxID=543379 RepID=A0A232F743_9HYME|nr:hypothetical protein TSAR_012572 [Trichomalopsis sarcophagae]